MARQYSNVIAAPYQPEGPRLGLGEGLGLKNAEFGFRDRSRI